MKNFFKKFIIFLARNFAKKIIKKNKPFIIAITGSFGKTSIKDAVYTILTNHFNVRKPQGGLNIDPGLVLALSVVGHKELKPGLFFLVKAVWKLFMTSLNSTDRKLSSDQILILEMAADKPGDIGKLVEIAPPNIGIITGVDLSHSKFIKRSNRIVKEERKLLEALPANGQAIIYGDNKKTFLMIKKTKAPVITYGIKKDNLVKATNIQFYNGSRSLTKEEEWGASFKLNYKENVVPVRLHSALDDGQILAVLAGASCGLALGLNLLEISESLAKYKPPREIDQKS